MTEAGRETAYVGLGSNLDEPVQQVTRALQELDRLPQTRVVGRSALYRTRPLGPQDQPDYINAAARLETALDPLGLLDQLLEMERRHGRVRRADRWGPRTLDLDLLLYGVRQMQDGRLVLPHPELTRRAFVLLPLAEVSPRELPIPGRGTLAQWQDRISRDGVRRL